MQCYTTHRDPTAFESPDAFLPERWIGRQRPTKDMKTLFLPFSEGTRACLGKSLAMMELKLIAATLVGLFDVSLGPGTTDASMTMKDHFLLVPKGGKCDLIFTPAK
jgi:cytochrome P450